MQTFLTSFYLGTVSFSMLLLIAWGVEESGGWPSFHKVEAYEVYQAILCNNCKYSFNISGTINNIFVSSSIVLRCFLFLFYYLFSFLWWEKLPSQLADIVEEFSRTVFFDSKK